MVNSSVNSLLNDLLVDLHRSLIQYAAEAWPWSTGHSRELRQAVREIARQQNEDVVLLVNLLRDRGHFIDFGMYPAEFTGLHYVALEFLLSQLKENQANLVRSLQVDLGPLQEDAGALEVVQRILASEEECLQKLSSSGILSESQTAPWMK